MTRTRIRRTVKTAVLKPSNAARLLRCELGDLCSWDDLLADARRNRRNLWRGLPVPHAIRLDGLVRYRMSDLRRFIADVQAAGLAHDDPADLGIEYVDLPA